MSNDDRNEVGRKKWPFPIPFDDLRHLYVGPITEAKGFIETDEGIEPLAVVMWGEVLFYQEPTRRLRRVALYGALLQPEQDARIGVFSLVGPLKTWQNSEALDDSVGLSLRLHYRALNPFRRPPTGDERPLPLPLEQMDAILTWEPVGPQTGPTLYLRVGLEAKLTEGLLGAVHSVTLEPHLVPFRLAGSGPSRQEPHNPLLNTCSSPSTACDPGLTTVVRTLPIKFVSFSQDHVSDDALDDLVDLCNQQILGVCDVWRNKAALDLVVWPNNTASISMVAAEIDVADPEDRVDYFEPDIVDEGSMPDSGYDSPNHVEVYLVDHLPDSSYGGGITHAGGEAEAYCILDIGLMPTNQYLLAHELGHALGLDHPDEPCPGSWESIVEPTGGAAANPNSNTLFNCRIFLDPAASPLDPTAPPPIFVTGLPDCDPRVASGNCVGIHNPLVSSVGPMDCFRPDPVDHFVRDFPIDAGAEPSMPPLGENRWSNSNVWNRRTNTPGGTNAAGGPEHEEPFCTDTENYMHVTLEHVTELRDPVCVDFYLADPGVSPGFELLVPLRPPDASGTPNHRLHFAPPPVPGSSDTRSLEWSWNGDVPPGYPLNCCVFALAHSMDEPLPWDPATVTFDTVFSLLGVSNNVAQRNLHVQSCTPAGPAPFWSPLPWVRMANPTNAARAARLEIDTSLAPALEGLTLEVGDEEWENLHLEDSGDVPLADRLELDQHLVLRLQAALPPDAELGTEFPIDLRFFVGDQLIIGYRHVLRVAPLSETMAQVLDSVSGAMRDVQAGCLAEGDRALAVQVQDGGSELVAAAAKDPEGALRELSALSGPISELAESPALLAGGEECLAIIGHLSRLVSLLAAPEDAASPSHRAEEIRDLANRIQEPAGRLARRRRQG